MPLVEFGESVLYKPLPGDVSAGDKLDDRFFEGIFLGFDTIINQYHIGTEDGLKRARTIKRRPEDKQWNSQAIKEVAGVPWEPNPSSSEPIKINIGPEFEDEIPPPRQVRHSRDEAPLTKRAPLRREDFIKFGFFSRLHRM